MLRQDGERLRAGETEHKREGDETDKPSKTFLYGGFGEEDIQDIHDSLGRQHMK